MGCGFESHRAYVSHAFLYAGVRTPFGRYAGALAGSRPDDLAATVVRGRARPGARASTRRRSTT